MADDSNTPQHISEIIKQLMGQLEEMAERHEREALVPEVDLLEGDDNECFFI